MQNLGGLQFIFKIYLMFSSRSHILVKILSFYQVFELPIKLFQVCVAVKILYIF